MSKLTIKSLGMEKHSEIIERFSQKLKELSLIEKELNTEGFHIELSEIKKKD